MNVYFIEAIGLNLIKIGVATSVSKRLSSLQSSSPAELLLRGVIKYGTSGLERLLHKHFSDQRHHGEWFRIDNRMRMLLEDPEGYCKEYLEWTIPEKIKSIEPIGINLSEFLDKGPDREAELAALFSSRAELMGLHAGGVAAATGFSLNLIKECLSGEIMSYGMAKIVAPVLKIECYE